MLNLTCFIFASIGFRGAAVELPFCFRHACQTEEFGLRSACYVLELNRLYPLGAFILCILLVLITGGRWTPNRPRLAPAP